MKNKSIKILAIETSCDETSASLVHVTCDMKHVTQVDIISNIVSSQVKLHAKYGGVYPELASREHIKSILPVIQASLKEASIKNLVSSMKDQNPQILNTKYKIIDSDFDYLAVTTGPGLIGSLLVGVNTAKTLAYTLKKPIYSMNHLEGHIYANFVSAISNFQTPISKQISNSKSQNPKFPLVALIVSGGHTSLVYMKNHLDYKVIGETLDDAAGEAFDKVAKLLKLGYPGGPVIAKMAMKIPSSKKQVTNKFQIPNFKFPRPMLESKDFNFSFSGLKTAVLYTLKKLPKPLNSNIKALICREFQDAIVETLIEKTIRAAKKYRVKSILLCGGVASNDLLRKKLKVESEKLKVDFFVPQKNLCTDNAAMIAVAAAYKIALGKKPTPWYNVNADSNLKLS